MHLLEPYWQDIRIQQVMGRAARICSHFDLPPEREKCNILFISNESTEGIKPTELLGEKTDESTDQVIYNHAIDRQELLDEFLIAMKEIAIDCRILKKQNFDAKLKNALPVMNHKVKKKYIKLILKNILNTVTRIVFPEI